jgi:hypothetical protein
VPPEQIEPTRVQDGLHPLYDLSGEDRVVREVGVVEADGDTPQKVLEGRPPAHAILPVEHDVDPMVFERVLVIESGSKVRSPGHHGAPTQQRGRSTLVASTEAPQDGSTVPPETTYPVALAVLNDLLKIVAGRLCMGLIDSANDPWHVAYEVQAGRFHQRPMTDVLIWARGQKEPGKGFTPSPGPTFTPNPPGSGRVETPDPASRTTTPDAGGGSSATSTPDPVGPGPTTRPIVETQDPSDTESASF